MEFAHIITFSLVAALLVISPGPNGILIAKTVSTSGKSMGFVNIVGFVCAFALHGCFAIFGMTVILQQSATAFFIVKLLGALYLCWLGAKALYAAWQGQRVSVATSGKANSGSGSFSLAFFEGFLTNLLNPKVSLFYLAAFPQFMTTEAGMASAFALVFIHALINVLWFSSMIMILARFLGNAANPWVQRTIKAVTGVVFMLFGIKLATSKVVVE